LDLRCEGKSGPALKPAQVEHHIGGTTCTVYGTMQPYDRRAITPPKLLFDSPSIGCAEIGRRWPGHFRIPSTKTLPDLGEDRNRIRPMPVVGVAMYAPVSQSVRCGRRGRQRSRGLPLAATRARRLSRQARRGRGGSRPIRWRRSRRALFGDDSGQQLGQALHTGIGTLPCLERLTDQAQKRSAVGPSFGQCDPSHPRPPYASAA
jgi:hypothetical protein